MSAQSPHHEGVAGSPRTGSQECKALLAMATPGMFNSNAFRVTGLTVDASVREITKRADRLKMMEELGQGLDVHTGAFSLSTPPSVDEIRNAIQRLRDPEIRVVHEFFWFWPEAIGNSAQDPAIQALERGEREAALDMWMANELNPSTGIIAIHNVAVFWQLIALECEEIDSRQGVPERPRAKIESYWRESFKRWNILADDDLFWEMAAERIRKHDDPRLTPGFVRQIRNSLTPALQKINAELALGYTESDRMELAKVHVQFMREIKWGAESLNGVAERVLAPVSSRVKQQIQRTKDRCAREAKEAIAAVGELTEFWKRTLPVFEVFFDGRNPAKDDLGDEIADAGNVIQVSYFKATQDLMGCFEILLQIAPFAVASHVKELIKKNTAFTVTNLHTGMIKQSAEARVSVKANPARGADEARRLLKTAMPFTARLSRSEIVPGIVKTIRDDMANAIVDCLAAYQNATRESCVPLYEECLKIACDAKLVQWIGAILERARQTPSRPPASGGPAVGAGTKPGNARAHTVPRADFRPLSSPPPTIGEMGTGVLLYGCTDKDETNGSFLTTCYYGIFWIPIIAVARYRVTHDSFAGRFGYNFIGEAPLRMFELIFNGVSIGVVVIALTLWLLLGSR